MSLNSKYSVSDLVTSSEEIEKGFIAQTLEKSRRAKPILDEASELKEKVIEIGSANELINHPELYSYLLLAAGVSTKAAQHLEESSKQRIIRALVDNCLLPAGDRYADEFVFRYLLAWGDSLGGSLRNWIGTKAKNRFTNILINEISKSKKSYLWLSDSKKLGQKGAWIQQEPNDLSQVKGLAWTVPSGKRVLLYNRKIPLVQKNVDVSVLNIDHEEIKAQHLKLPNFYVALGEIKGGIDPAGADEHWKTAISALNRIRGSFAREGLMIKTFFVGAIIVQSQAQEILSQLDAGLLDYAANLTKDDQMTKLSSWLLSL